MAGEVDDIVQNVVLTGSEDVAATFERIKQAGEQAFEGLASALEKAIPSGLLTTFENLGHSFGGIATAAAGVVGAVSLIGVGLFEFTKHTEESVIALNNLALQTGSTVEEISGLRAAFAAGGVGAGEMATAFRRLGIEVQRTWEQIKKQSRDGVDTQKKDAVDISNAQIALANAQQKQATLSRDQAFARQKDLEGIAGAEQRLEELQLKQLEKQGLNVDLQKDILQSQRDDLEIEQAQLAIKEAKAKASDAAANRERDVQKAINDTKTAELTLSNLQRKADDDRKNDIGNIIESVKALAEGNKDALNNINNTTENLIKGIVGSIPGAEEALGSLRGDITDLSAPAPKAIDGLNQLIKVMSNLDNAGQKSALVRQVFGRSLGQEAINVLSNADKIRELQKRTEDLGLATKDVDVEIGEKFRSTLFQFQNDVGLVSNKLATAFGPAFIDILNTFDQALLANKDKIIGFAQEIANNAVPVIESFIRVLSGAPDAVQDQWLVNYVDKIKAFGNGVSEAAGVAVSAFKTIGTAAGGVADALNAVFGTNLNTFDVLLGAWVAKAIVHFAELTAAATTAATGIEVGMAPVLGVFGGLAIAIYTAVKAFQALSDIFGLQGQTSHWDAILEGTEQRLKGIAQILTGDIAKGWQTIADANKKQEEDEKALDDADATNKLLQKNRFKDVADEATKQSQTALQSQTDALHSVAEESKKSADSRIEDERRASAAAQESAQKQKNLFADQEKLRQTRSDKPEVFGNGTDNQSLIIDVKKQLQEIQDALAKSALLGGKDVQLGGIDSLLHVISEASLNSQELKQAGLPKPRPEGAPQNREDSVSIVRDGVEQGFNALRSGNGPTDIPGGDVTGGLNKLRSGTGPTEIPTGEPGLIQSLKDLFTPLLDNLNSHFQDQQKQQDQQATQPNQIDEAVKNAIQSLTDTLSGLFNQLIQNNTQTQGASAAPDTQNLNASFSTAASDADTLASSFSSLQSATDQLAGAFQSAASSASSRGTISAASGGWIRGPGTETSDSIPAWLSHNEYVQPAAATNYYGLAFMEAIRTLRLPRFNMGGLVNLFSPMMPRFAEGGLARDGAGGLPHLGMVDLRTDRGPIGVIVNRDSLSDLKRAAVQRQIGSSPKPAWVR